MMKDTIITARRKRIELWVLLGSFLAANLINFFSIVAYNTTFKELYTQWLWVLLFTVGIYGLSIVVRLIVKWIILLIKRIIKKR